METLTVRQARRLALARGGLLAPRWSGLPARASGRGRRARAGAHAVLGRFGYLQLDTVSVAGARSHVIVLLSRLGGFDPELGEALLRPGEPLFEYWGHEASWIPLELYPAFEFRRREYRRGHPWWGDLAAEHPRVAERLRRRLRDEGPLRTADMEGASGAGWWDLKLAKKVAAALWSSGELAIRAREGFQKVYDLAERVIPEAVRARPLSEDEGLEVLLLRALAGHGWASEGTLAATWRLTKRRDAIRGALARLAARGEALPCALVERGARPAPGWVRPADLELAARLDRLRPRGDRGVLLSPFDPLLWDRTRAARLFDGFGALLEVFKPAAERKYGYYCLPVLAGERLVARFDLKAERAAGTLRVVACHFEGDGGRPARAADAEAARSALERYAGALGLETAGWRPPG